MKKRKDRFEREFNRLKNIISMLDSEGEKTGETRYKEFVATVLLFIDDSLSSIRLALFILLGFVIGKFISGLL